MKSSTGEREREREREWGSKFIFVNAFHFLPSNPSPSEGGRKEGRSRLAAPPLLL